jgi:tetratricopeptide (TPR) repeat protein
MKANTYFLLLLLVLCISCYSQSIQYIEYVGQGSESYKAAATDFYNRGHALVESGKYRAAIECFTNALAFDPKNEKYLLSRGICYTLIENNQTLRDDYLYAIADYNRIIENNPYHLDALISRASAKLRLNDNTSISDISRVIKIDKNNVQAWYLGGYYHYIFGDRDKAYIYATMAKSLGHENADWLISKINQM